MTSHPINATLNTVKVVADVIKEETEISIKALQNHLAPQGYPANRLHAILGWLIRNKLIEQNKGIFYWIA